MMKRLITLIVAAILVCTTSWANEEHTVKLVKGDSTTQTIDLPFGIISFDLVDYGNYQRVLVSLENTTTDVALIVFKNSLGEKTLKKNKPKIEFEKTYPGSKGDRTVNGCKELNKAVILIVPPEKLDLCTVDFSSKSKEKLELPVYQAKYDPKKLDKKGVDNTNFKILSEDVFTFNIEVKGWSEKDPEYVATKKAVEEFIQSVNNAVFCKSKKHKPSLKDQKAPYIEKKDSLINVIKATLENHSEWLSVDKPHQKYSELLAQLNEVNLNKHESVCTKHKKVKKDDENKKKKEEKKKREEDSNNRIRSCGYCSLSEQSISHQLDDLYQRLRRGRLSKAAAKGRAQGLYNCYMNHGRKNKRDLYFNKITNFYKAIKAY